MHNRFWTISYYYNIIYTHNICVLCRRHLVPDVVLHILSYNALFSLASQVQWEENARSVPSSPDSTLNSLDYSVGRAGHVPFRN